MKRRLQDLSCDEIMDAYMRSPEYAQLEAEEDWQAEHAEEINEMFIRELESNPRSAPGYRKQPIPSSLRWAVWERNNFTCVMCGARNDLQVGHIIPESKGGLMTMENLRTECRTCNCKRGTKGLDD